MQKFHWFSLWYIILFPFPALKSKVIIKNAFLHLDKLLIIKMKSIYKISLKLVLWRQVMQMTGLLLGWQNEIYSLILCSYLVCGYGDVQIESPVLGNQHEPLWRERGGISLLPSWDTQPPSLSCWLVGGSMTVFHPGFQVIVPYASFFPFWMESGSLNSSTARPARNHDPWLIFWFWKTSQCVISGFLMLQSRLKWL